VLAGAEVLVVLRQDRSWLVQQTAEGEVWRRGRARVPSLSNAPNACQRTNHSRSSKRDVGAAAADLRWRRPQLGHGSGGRAEGQGDQLPGLRRFPKRAVSQWPDGGDGPSRVACGAAVRRAG